MERVGRGRVLLLLAIVTTCVLYGALFVLGRVQSIPFFPTQTLQKLRWLDEVTARLMPDNLEAASRRSELAITNMLLFGLVALGLIGMWVLALRLARAGEVHMGLWWILMPVALFSVPLVLMPGMFSMDAYLYMFYGRTLSTYGENPILIAPNQFAGDPHLGWFPYWKNLRSAYGPVWLMLSGGLSTIAGESRFANIVTYKVATLGLHVLTIVAIWLLLRRVRPESAAWGAVFYGWNPLVLIEVVNSAHNDVMIAAFAVLSLLAVSCGRWLLAVFLVSAAGMVKLTALVLMPFLVLAWMIGLPSVRARLRAALLATAVAVVSSLALYAPLWAGAALLENSLENPAATRYAHTFWAVLGAILNRGADRAARDAVQQQLHLVRNAAFVLAFIFLVLWFVRGRRELAHAWVWGWFLYCLSLSWIWPWYFVLPIAIAAARGPSRTAALAGGLTFGGMLFWFGWTAPRISPVTWLNQYKSVLLFGPPLLIVVWPALGRGAERLLSQGATGTRQASDNKQATSERIGGRV